MSLVSLGLVGKNNEPLYLRDFPFNSSQTDQVEDDLLESNAPDSGLNNQVQCSLRTEFVILSSLDRFDELTVSRNWRTPGATGSDTMWVGLICPVDEHRIYGYLINTGIKILAVIEDTFAGGQNQQSAREIELKSFFAKIHSLYVEHVLNPFNKLNSTIISETFDNHINDYVEAFNNQNSIGP